METEAALHAEISRLRQIARQTESERVRALEAQLSRTQEKLRNAEGRLRSLSRAQDRWLARESELERAENDRDVLLADQVQDLHRHESQIQALASNANTISGIAARAMEAVRREQAVANEILTAAQDLVTLYVPPERDTAPPPPPSRQFGDQWPDETVPADEATEHECPDPSFALELQQMQAKEKLGLDSQADLFAALDEIQSAMQIELARAVRAATGGEAPARGVVNVAREGVAAVRLLADILEQQ